MHSLQDPVEAGSFVAGLSAAEIAALKRLGRIQEYPTNAPLFRQGEPTRHVAVLTKGWVKVVSSTRHGEEAFLAIRGPGDVLGELSAVDGEPRSATVTALVDVCARVVQGDLFVTTVCGSPRLSLGLLRYLATHLRDSDRRRLEYVSTSTFERLVGLLIELADTYGDPGPDGGVVIRLPLTQRDLAAAAAMSREAVARGLRTLRERNLVGTDRRRITITRPQLLRRLAASVPDDT